MLPTPRILDFWFGTGRAPRTTWPDADEAFGDSIRETFEGTLHEALRGAFSPRLLKRDDRLALLVLTDQMPRYLYRGEKKAFVGDEMARSTAMQIIASGQDEKLPEIRRMFVYLPFQHAEDMRLQGQSLMLFRKLAIESPAFQPALERALRHYETVARFGRFPQRNAALRRPSTAEELAYLETPEAAL